MKQILLALALTLPSVTLAAGPSFEVRRVAAAAEGNRKVSLRLDKSGTPSVAFTGCSDLECKNNELMFSTLGKDGKWATESVDDTNKDTGWFASMEIAPEGTVHVLYANHNKFTLRHAVRKTNGKWKLDTIGSGHGGWWNATALSSDGTLWHAGMMFPKDDLNYPALQLGTLLSGKWTFETADYGKDVGWFPAITLDAASQPVVTYMTGGYATGDLRLLRRSADGNWENEWIGRSVSKSAVAVAPNGTVYVAYQYGFNPNCDNANLMVARSEAPGSWENTLVDGNSEPVAETGHHPAIAIDSKGGVHILHREMTKNCMAYARNLGSGWENLGCAYARGDGGLYPSMLFDSKDRLHVAYDTGRFISYGVCADCAAH